MIVLPQNPHKMRYKRDRHTREHRERIASRNRVKAKIASAVAAWEANSPRAPISLAKFSIQQEPEE
jgi:hypothetical protein